MRDAECEKDPLGAVKAKRTLVPLGCFLGWLCLAFHPHRFMPELGKVH